MRIWSLHPKYLDRQGLLALWREGLLAKKVLENKTKRYKNHPQLDRFKKYKNPEKAINIYLNYVYEESKKRGYKFNKEKINNKKINNKKKDSYKINNKIKKENTNNKENTKTNNKEKINTSKEKKIIPVNSEQIKYEYLHFLKKLKQRNPLEYNKLKKLKKQQTEQTEQNKIKANPIFYITKGEIENWEKKK